MIGYVVPSSAAAQMAQLLPPDKVLFRVTRESEEWWVSRHRVPDPPAGVEVYESEHPFLLVSRAFRKANTVIAVRDAVIGHGGFTIIAGPCSVESPDQMDTLAAHLSASGVRLMRGGAFKPRTSPYSFQGLGIEGLQLFRQVADCYGMGVVSELLDLSLLDTLYPYVDVIQVGSRNMFNYHLLKELGKVDKPILLKRGMFATVEEWLLAAEYILAHGNDQVILCERGIRSFDPYFRNLIDFNAVALVKQLSHLPVVIDPSQGTGRRDIIIPMGRAAHAVGADGLMVEVHPQPEQALSDGFQSLSLPQFDRLMEAVHAPMADTSG